MLSKGINDSLFNSVYEKIDNLISRYVNDDGVDYYMLKNYYKKLNNIKNLINEIQNEGERMFDIKEDYYSFIKDVLKEVLDDRISEYETNKLSESNLFNFNDFIEKKNGKNDE